MAKSLSKNPFILLDDLVLDEEGCTKAVLEEFERLRRYIDLLEAMTKPGIVDALRKAVWG